MQGRRAAAWQWLSRQQPKLVHALRMTVSALATFALAAALGLPQGFWAVITALIVTQSSVGSLIVRLGTAGAARGPRGFAADRILEIGLGCAVGILVSVLVAPARASHAVLDTAAQVARLLADQLERLALPSDELSKADLGSVVAKTRQALNRLETLVAEAAHERRSHLAADAPDPEPLLRTLLRLRHDLIMLRRTVWEPGGGEMVREQLARPWASAVAAGAAALREVGAALSGRRTPARSGALAETVDVYTAAIDEMRRRDLTRALPSDMVGRMSGARFALDQFRRNLDDLTERARERSVQAKEGVER